MDKFEENTQNQFQLITYLSNIHIQIWPIFELAQNLDTNIGKISYQLKLVWSILFKFIHQILIRHLS